MGLMWRSATFWKALNELISKLLWPSDAKK
jgi:hypothetical protein